MKTKKIVSGERGYYTQEEVACINKTALSVAVFSFVVFYNGLLQGSTNSNDSPLTDSWLIADTAGNALSKLERLCIDLFYALALGVAVKLGIIWAGGKQIQIYTKIG